MDDDASRLADRAEQRFRSGHNCAQSTLWTVAEAMGISCPECIPGVALAMGGGIGHTGQACGALTGGVMAIGLAVDRFTEESQQGKKDRANGLAARFVDAFVEGFGTPDCAQVLGFSWREPDALERFRREDAMGHKCAPCVRWAVAEAHRLARDVKAEAG